jgi:hypothetical protein
MASPATGSQAFAPHRPTGRGIKSRADAGRLRPGTFVGVEICDLLAHGTGMLRRFLRTGIIVGYRIGLKNHASGLDQLADRGLDGGLGARRRAQLHASIVEMKIDRSLRQSKRLRDLP